MMRTASDRNVASSAGRRKCVRDGRGLTVVEVLVALALLGIVSAAIVGSFSLLVTLNRGASVDVDYGRVVRSVSEKIVNDWKVPSEWIDATVGGYGLAGFVDVETDGRCTASYEDAEVPEVRVVTVLCFAERDLAEQVYQFEIGSPLP